MNNFAISVGTFVRTPTIPLNFLMLKQSRVCVATTSSKFFKTTILRTDYPPKVHRLRDLLFPVSVSRAVDMEEFPTQQQVSATVSLAGYPVQDISWTRLKHLQNRRWNNAKTNLKPTFINDGLLTYNFMGSESFDGGTEFHTFDTKRLNQVGLGVKIKARYVLGNIFI